MLMKRLSWILSLTVLLSLFSCKKEKDRVLVFSKTAGYRHESIEDGRKALIELGRNNNFEVDTTEDASAFTEENLKRYQAIIFLSTTQDVLDDLQQSHFKRYIEAGGGFVGIHAASDTEFSWPWYGKLVGAYFKSHPQIQEAKLKQLQKFGSLNLPETWVRTDEWYNFKNISDDISVIYTLDESSYKGGENGDYHPIAWFHEFAGGRAFYTALGHTKESYTDSLFLEHVLQGIRYAIGENNKLDYDKVKSKVIPEENRFTKVVLDFNLYEPTEMAVLPDGKIIFLERRGNVKLYNPTDGKVKVINTFNVWSKEEDGMIGLAIDPNFKENNWVYIFYSHPERSSNIVSRFVFKDGKIDQSSEKEIIEVPVQRQTCCHTGGSLAFGPGGNLFISTGDNTSPFESNGYSPSDERPDRSPFDAQKSSSNTNDLRGKILRIHPEPDGSYTIPEGNLFAKGEPNARPEIYVMGCRNPYRISIDEKNGFLYWGEVGPDAGETDSLRGPRGYDEVNQARKAGFFGWPYFVGNNYNYAHYDFANKKVGERWNPKSPVNTSPNNTGKKDLPPAVPAYIWYPYAKSDEFPMMKEGSRNAMAGPIYYSEKYKGVDGAFPDYFDGKVMIYDWMRNWMFLVSQEEDGSIYDIEPFMPSTKFNNIIDMQYGPDGKLYMLEYGTAWFKQNIDARLVRIDYNGGNRAPVAMLSADKFNGAVPLNVTFDTKGTNDPDGDKLKYEMNVGGKIYTSDNGKFNVTLDKAGVYNAEFKAIDEKGLSTTATLQVVAGNESPEVSIDITRGNKMFYFPGTEVGYSISVSDKEDGTTKDNSINAESVKVSFNFVKGYDMATIPQGHQRSIADLPGKTLMDKSDCKSCHMIDQKSAGPAYQEIARKYKSQEGSVDQLAAKIIKGGSGVWGNTEMSAHPQLSVDDARLMVQYIFSLTDEKLNKTLPLSGGMKTGKEDNGVYILTATYTDKAHDGLPSITGEEAYILTSPVIKADAASQLRGPRVLRYQGNVGLENVKNNSSAAFENLDLTGVKKIEASAFVLAGTSVGGQIELRLDALDGEVLGTVDIRNAGLTANDVKIQKNVSGVHTIYTIFKNPSSAGKDLFYFGALKLKNR
jgi:cytochrome c